MIRRHLRLFPSPLPVRHPPAPASTTPTTLRELLPLIARARRENRAWLRDFLDDEVRVTSDLYEVLQAFHVCRPSA